MHWAKGGQSARPGDGSGPMRRRVACPQQQQGRGLRAAWRLGHGCTGSGRAAGRALRQAFEAGWQRALPGFSLVQMTCLLFHGMLAYLVASNE